MPPCIRDRAFSPKRVSGARPGSTRLTLTLNCRSSSASDSVNAFTAAYQDFCARVDAGEDTIIDPYASDSPGEFFAVFSEAFFELPDVVRAEYPAAYEQLSQFYRQDPLARLERSALAGARMLDGGRIRSEGVKE